MKKRRLYRPSSCGLQFDNHYTRRNPCHGDLKPIAGVWICQRHRDLVDLIAGNTHYEQPRHPISHRGRLSA